MTKFRLPNDLSEGEGQLLIQILREQASSFLDWGYDETSFWIELGSQDRNPWPKLLRELSERANSESRRRLPISGERTGRAVV